jgi:amino acid transporter
VALTVEPAGRAPEKGLKSGAIGLISSVVIGVASTAPAYSLAATLGFVIVAIGLQAPIVAILAFVPMWFVSIAFAQMNKADPDCGASFTWATRAFNPRVGWMGGWGVLAADIIVMASLSQIAGQYVFDLFNTSSIGNNASSVWVLLVGVGWIVVMTWICYIGIEVSANFQKGLLSIEIVMLIVMSVWALIRVGDGSAPVGHIAVAASWFDPFKVKHFNDFVIGLADMLFIYWGWDTALNLNEETTDAEVTPGKAGIYSTFLLLGIYALVIIATESFAGIGTHGIGLGNQNHTNDVLSILGPAIFGHSTFASVLDHLLLLMVLSSASSSTQTTILPTARTVLSMSVHKALPDSFAKIHKRFLTPTVATVSFGVVSAALYIAMNFISAGHVISDSVDALGVMIAFYYGLTGFSCAWYYRKTSIRTVRNFFVQLLAPLTGGVILWLILGWSFWYYWNPNNSYTTWDVFGRPIGGTFTLDVGSLLIGIILMFTMNIFRPAFFRGETLRRDSPTLVTEDFLARPGRTNA